RRGRGRRRGGDDDAHHPALPGRRIDARRSRAARRCGARRARRRSEPGVGSAVGSVEDERRSAPRTGDAVMTETKLRKRPAAVALTGGAEARVAELMAKAPDGALGVRLSTPRRGCSGLAYSVDYVTAEEP